MSFVSSWLLIHSLNTNRIEFAGTVVPKLTPFSPCIFDALVHFDARCHYIHMWCEFTLKRVFSVCINIDSAVLLCICFLGCSWKWRIDLTAAWPRIIMQALCVPARIEAQNCPPTAFDDRLHFDSTLRPLFPPTPRVARCPVLSCLSFVCLSGLFIVDTVSLWTIWVYSPWVVITPRCCDISSVRSAALLRSYYLWSLCNVLQELGDSAAFWCTAESGYQARGLRN